MNTRKLKERIAALEAEVQRLQPTRSLGMLTSKTQRGVIRKPTARAQSTNATYIIPRWG